MRRVQFIFIVCFFALASCEPGNKAYTTSEQQNNNNQRKRYAIEGIIDTCFSEMPNVMNNDLTKQTFADTLKTRIQKYCGKQLPFLKEIPMKYEMCLPYKGSDFYVVKFSEDFDDKDFDEYEITFQVFTKMNKDEMMNLVDNKCYYIDGVFVDFANSSAKTGFVLPSGKCLIDYPRVWESLSERPMVDLGTMILEDLKYYPCEN